MLPKIVWVMIFLMTEQDQMGAFVQEAFRKYGKFGHDFLVISAGFQHPHLKHLEYQTLSVGEVHKVRNAHLGPC
jgi:hypothetical protein